MKLVDRKLVEVPGRIDECDIYAVFYERTADMEYLDVTIPCCLTTIPTS